MAFIFNSLTPAQAQDPVLHTDSVYGFQISVPAWWDIKETPPDFFGGTFPAINGIENALIFKCYKKDQFKDMKTFERWVFKDYGMGQNPQLSQDIPILLKTELSDFKEVGNAYKVQLLNGGKIYNCCYIITETTTAYIWIDFTATPKTYPKNFYKLKIIIGKLKRF